MNEQLARIFSQSYLKPVLRTKIDFTNDIFISDGVVPISEITNFNATFPVHIEESCHATVWFVQESAIAYRGGVVITDLASLTNEKQRIAAALAKAAIDLKMVKH